MKWFKRKPKLRVIHRADGSMKPFVLERFMRNNWSTIDFYSSEENAISAAKQYLKTGDVNFPIWES